MLEELGLLPQSQSWGNHNGIMQIFGGSVGSYSSLQALCWIQFLQIRIVYAHSHELVSIWDGSLASLTALDGYLTKSEWECWKFCAREGNMREGGWWVRLNLVKYLVVFICQANNLTQWWCGGREESSGMGQANSSPLISHQHVAVSHMPNERIFDSSASFIPLFVQQSFIKWKIWLVSSFIKCVLML